MSDLIDREQVISAFDTDDNELIIRGSENADSVEQYLKRVMYKIEGLPSAQLGTNLAEVGTDCISRQAAIRWVKTECNPFGMPTLDFESGKKVIDHLDQMPSAQPEPKRGKWKTAYLDHVSMGIRPKVLYCSECNQCIAYPTNFCPNCGADMRGERDEQGYNRPTGGD